MLKRRVLHIFAIIERPAAWGLLIGGVITFFSVVIGLIVVGDAKLATLLVAADLIVGGFSAVQETEDGEPDRRDWAPSRRVRSSAGSRPTAGRGPTAALRRAAQTRETSVCPSASRSRSRSKNSRRSTDRAAIGTWLRELEAEVKAVGDEAGAVIHKRRGTTDVGEYVVIMPVKYLNHLLTATYGKDAREIVPASQRRRSIPGLRLMQ